MWASLGSLLNATACGFIENNAEVSAGAVSIEQESSGFFDSCNFVANGVEAASYGGAVVVSGGYDGDTASGHFTRCTFDGNVASVFGGAVYAANGAVSVYEACLFRANEVVGSSQTNYGFVNGGAVALYFDSNARIISSQYRQTSFIIFEIVYECGFYRIFSFGRNYPPQASGGTGPAVLSPSWPV